MTTRLNPYLGFDGNAREAMEFYRSVLGGTLTVSTYGEGGMSDDPAQRDKIMHATLETDGGLTLMGADVPSPTEAAGPGSISLSLSGEDAEELSGYYEKLAAGGTVTMPLEAAPWGDTFGMCTDAYGVAWMVNIAGAGH
ncbi:MAG: VOC family protein [Nocardioidaceae bacterium]